MESETSKLKNFFYGSPTKRVMTRFIEIGILSLIAGILASPELKVLLPLSFIPIIAAILKAIREYLD